MAAWAPEARGRRLQCSRRSAPYQPDDEKKHHGAHERGEDHPRQATEGRAHPEPAEQPSANEGADDADDDVADQAVTRAAHHERREYAGDQADEDPGE